MSIEAGIVSAVPKAYEIVSPTLLRQCGYAVFCNSYANDLKDEIKKLKDASIRLQHKVDRAESVREIIEDDVLTWLSKANKLIVSGNLILQESKVSCFRFVLNPKARYVLGRRSKKCLTTIKEHLDGGKFDEVSFQPVAEPTMEVKVKSATSSSVRYVELKSRALVLQKIIAALDDHKKIGIYGMGGVGKTTLLKEVEKIAKESGKFDDVVSAFVSQTPDIEGIKSKIRNKLKRLESYEDDTSKKTVLILLDDLWEEFKGIGVLENDTKVNVKWVMTSRKQALLSKEMFCHPTFALGVLDEEEGWHLFRELVMSKNNVEDLKRNPTTVELLKKCAGLPVSIEALATIWKNKGLSPTDLISVKELNLGKESEDGSISLELSYSYLRDQDGKEEAKLLFRTIGLLGTPTVPILTLLKYTVGLDLFGSNNNDKIMERSRREVIRSVCTLQDSSLLLKSDDINHIKIHDLVRDVAIRITSRDDHALIFNPGDGVKGWSREKKMDSTIVSLPYSALPMLLYNGWECPNAKIFIIRFSSSEQGGHVELPDSFFKGMVKLKIIDLRNARLTSLPSSIQSDIHNLTTLCLDYCYLEDVASIGKLKSLQVLSFVGSEIGELPEEIGGLTNLRMLDLSKCSNLKSIKPGVLGRLTRLEELYLKESFDRWKIEGDERQQSNSNLAELNNMVHLSTLELRVRDDSKLPSSLPLGDLVQYKVLMGDMWDWSGEYKESRTLKIKVKWDNIMTEEWLQSALQKIQDFHLDGLSGTKESFHEVCCEGFNELKHLHLQNCSLIKSIVWSMKCLSYVAFPTLESMLLENLESLEKICNGLIILPSFSKLKIVRVQDCHKLRNIFNISFVKSLPELEEIEVSDCNMVREILIAEKMDDDGDGGTIEDDKKVMTCCSDNLFCYPIKRSSEVSKTQSDAEESSCEDYAFKLDKLHSLTLRNLPELTSFFTKETSNIDSTNIPLPAFFNDQQVLLHNSGPLKFYSRSKFKDISSSAHLTISLGALRRVVVENCNRIVTLFDSRMLLKLGNLESLTIEGCDSLENIFDLEGIDSKTGHIEILPKFLELKLWGLPKLVHIWKNSFKQIKGCQNLRTLEIHECDNLSYLSGSSMCKGMENLTEIKIVQCHMMHAIFMEENEPTKDASTVIQLTSLKIIHISRCPSLKAFLLSNCHTTSNHVCSCLNLDYPKGFKCSDKSMTCWCFGKQDSIRGDTCISFFSNKVSLPSLESLFLSSSGKFEKIWCIELPNDKSYFNLEFVKVESCHTLSVVFHATLIERLQNLQQLWVGECMKLRCVVDWKGKKRSKEFMLSRLQKLDLIGLVNMTHVMDSGETDILVAFPNLKQLTVNNCSKLMYLIPTFTATTLLKLETLSIDSCMEMQEVINGEVSDCYKRNVINFPRLTSLRMRNLQSVTHFSSESYLFDFTCLKSIFIEKCENLETLVKPTSLDHDLGSEATTRVQALFNNKVNLPNLEDLDIKFTGVEELWCSEPLTTSFCKLKSLTVWYCNRLRNIIPSFIVKRLQYLEVMEIWGCNLLDGVFEIPSNGQIPSLHDSRVLEGCITEQNKQSAGTLELLSLKNLSLYYTAKATVESILEKVYLPNLENLEVGSTEITGLWHNEPLFESFCKLRNLEVYECGQLTMIIPPFMLKRMKNLENLEVSHCDQLQTVAELGVLIEPQGSESKLPHSPFEKLTYIQVEFCDSLISLFTISERPCEYGDTSECRDEIVLPHLKSLILTELPNLSHLFKDQEGKYSLDLSSLMEFILINSGAKEAISQKVIFSEDLKIREDDIPFFGSTTTVAVDIMKALRQTEKTSEIIVALGEMDDDLKEEVVRIIKEEEKMFDEVVDCRLIKSAGRIQDEFGRALGIVYGTAGIEERAQRLRKALLSNREKRLLLITTLSSDDETKAVGVPSCEELGPKFFKQIVISSETVDPMIMGHQRVIQIGYSIGERWTIFGRELCTMRFPRLQHQQQLQVETNTNNEISSFVGSNTAVMNQIINALLNSNIQIIGLLGKEGIKYYHDMFTALADIIKTEDNLFDDIVDLDGNNIDARDIVRQLRDDTGAGFHERTQLDLGKRLLDNKDKRILLLILRDLDHELDLHQHIGIPREGLDPKLFKIVLFSKNKEVMHKMGVQQVIDITDITDSNISLDSSNYWRILDGYVENSDLRKLADECGCDDLAKLLAKKLRSQGLRAWENAFQRLKESPFEYEMRRRVINSL